MSWPSAQELESMLVGRDKPLFYTGYIGDYERFLIEDERLDLRVLLNLIEVFASGIESSIWHGLLVGSAASQYDHADLDLLLCSDPSELRGNFARGLIRSIPTELFSTHVRENIGSAPILTNRVFGNQKAMLFARNGQAMIDLTFMSNSAGSWEEAIEFHAKNNLAYAIVR